MLSFRQFQNFRTEVENHKRFRGDNTVMRMIDSCTQNGPDGKFGLLLLELVTTIGNASFIVSMRLLTSDVLVPHKHALITSMQVFLVTSKRIR
ncbi:hypothetical protein SARC_13546 [Sphaeroforma arctica JP610]|uniref:Uncharacterized protein n=1 Tax=Sphaeroforma arctica JP610 TaxID=667725 RepID=A0A0L0FAV8_9EUKA|nr:hypothetical protein SARC_13546 [Sphaeroforma arctica JP610]KNC73895.1 hypothetical protein SARC_13546 [Sphaeroforma arctica JP610]|eukprot:XP_014147797.1 hypothetical protein SARC_13546 [Sphaeroforma arctica JP610]